MADADTEVCHELTLFVVPHELKVNPIIPNSMQIRLFGRSIPIEKI